jgi:YjbE family integral membrane protein
MEWSSMEYAGALLQILMINIMLSVDNAVVIAMASRGLPDRQRKLAIWWGIFGAIALRIVLTIIVQYLLQIPLLQAAGGVLLLWIAIKLLVMENHHDGIRQSASLVAAVWTIIVADFVMSLDNVLAIAAAAKGDVSLIVIGLLLSIPLIIWGSTLVSSLLERYPVLEYIGAGILGFIAGEMVVADPVSHQYVVAPIGLSEHAVPWVTVALVVASGYLWRIKKRERG